MELTRDELKTVEGECAFAFRAGDEFFCAAFDHTWVAMALLAPDGRYLKANPAFCELLGYSEVELLDRDFQSVTHPDDFSFSLGQTRKILAGEIPFSQEEIRYIHKSGDTVWVSTSVSLVRSSAGGAPYFIEQSRDISAEKFYRQELIESLGQLALLTSELGLSGERERRRIAQALHDHVVQKLAIGKLKLDSALQKKQITGHPAISDLQTILETSMQDLRDLAFDLSPPILYDLGLKAAINSLGEKLANEFSFKFTYSGDPEELQLSEDVKITLFQVVRELLINIVKHAGATAVNVTLREEGGNVRLEVTDDGTGFDPARHREGFGLASIRQRVNYLKGDLTVGSAPGTGTGVAITIASEFRKDDKGNNNDQNPSCRRP